MKVDGNLPARPTTHRGGRTTGGGSGQFSAEMAASPHGTRLSGAAPIVGAAAIMALQEVADRGEGRRRSIRQAGRLLDLLDELRVGLLTGGVSSETLADLSRLAGEARERVDSPELQQVLDEIDLRAQVELAKYEAIR